MLLVLLLACAPAPAPSPTVPALVGPCIIALHRNSATFYINAEQVSEFDYREDYKATVVRVTDGPGSGWWADESPEQVAAAIRSCGR